MSEVQDHGPGLWSEQWAVDASVKAEVIESRMRQSLASMDPDPRAKATAAAILQLVERGRVATTRTRRRRRTFMDAWRGTSVGEAYQSLHAAEVLLLDLLPEEDLEAMRPMIVARACDVLHRDDPRLAALDTAPDADPGVRRAFLRNTLSLVYEAADQSYVRVRDFRNVLYISAGLIAVLIVGMVVMVATQPTMLPFCFDPEEGKICPSGGTDPTWYDILIIVGLGLLGGALAAAFSIRHLRGTNLPYDIPIALAMLKVPSGSLTAVVGMLLLGGGFVPGLSELDNQRQILAYALLFGYAQQIATRLVDERAQRVIDSVPSKPEPSSVQTDLPRPRPSTETIPALRPTVTHRPT
jgi:hypothetical protein